MTATTRRWPDDGKHVAVSTVWRDITGRAVIARTFDGCCTWYELWVDDHYAGLYRSLASATNFAVPLLTAAGRGADVRVYVKNGFRHVAVRRLRHARCRRGRVARVTRDEQA